MFGPKLLGDRSYYAVSLLMVLEAQGIEIPKPAPCDLYIASMGEDAAVRAMELAAALRSEGFAAESDLVGRSLKAQMKYADKLGAHYALIVGQNEVDTGRVTVKDMQKGESFEAALDGLKEALLAR